MVDDYERIKRRRRKWKISYVIGGLLVVLAVGFVIFRLNQKSKLERKLEEIRAAGHPTNGAELNEWYSIPEGSENAADFILEAFTHYYKWDEQYLKELPCAGRAELPGRTEPITEETKVLIKEYLTDNNETLELLHKGALIEQSRYPIDFTRGFDVLLPHLADIRSGVRMLELEAVLSAEDNEGELAVNCVEAIFGVAGSLNKEPILVSQLVRIACEGLGVSALERVINKDELSDEQLIKASKFLFSAENSCNIFRGFAGERCVTSMILSNPSSVNFSEFYNGPVLSKPLIFLYETAGMADSDALLYLDLTADYMEVFEVNPEQRIKTAKVIDLEVNKISKIHVFLRFLMPAFTKCISIDLRCIAGLRAARVGLAAERHRLATGKLPEVLDELVPKYLEEIPTDPFDGEQIRYKKLDKGFVVYSVGEDGLDDGGKERVKKRGRGAGADTYDITFIVER